MNKYGIILAGVVTALAIIIYVPRDIIYIIGCYQVGSWIGGFVHDKLNEN
jgi:hypothetical protein